MNFTSLELTKLNRRPPPLPASRIIETLDRILYRWEGVSVTNVFPGGIANGKHVIYIFYDVKCDFIFFFISLAIYSEIFTQYISNIS